MPGVKIKGKHQIVGRILGQNREVYLVHDLYILSQFHTHVCQERLAKSRCIDALSGFEEYQFHHMHWVCHCDFEVSHNAYILPSFQHFNAISCNILIFGIIFNYDCFQFSINLWPESVTKRSQNRPIRLYSNVWNLWALDPTRGPKAGPWTPRQFTLRSLR